jgi:glycosyltransferase involved in cell wall biosynthesis
MSSPLTQKPTLPNKYVPKILFSSFHSYFDPSSGAALSTRDLLELLTKRGWPCRVFCASQMDFEESEALPQLLADHGIRYGVQEALAGSLPFSMYHLTPAGVPVTIFDSPTIRPYQEPGQPEGELFLSLLDGMLDRFQPDVLLTYGGNWVAKRIMAQAKRRGCRVVFALHNFAYTSAQLFGPVDAILVPSECARAHYRRALGLESVAIPGPWDWDRVKCAEVVGQYVTFVNPQPHKGVFVFARLAAELGRLRPDIPLLVVEGRAKASWLARTGLDFRKAKNLFSMANTPDPRDFYKVSRIVVMPSLWQESFPRVAAEALINGIPVLATRRGGTPEVLQDAGFLFDVPDRYTADSREVPTVEEVSPWIEIILKLWDDPSFYAAEQQRCGEAAEAWRPERLAPRVESFFHSLVAPTASTVSSE